MNQRNQQTGGSGTGKGKQGVLTTIGLAVLALGIWYFTEFQGGGATSPSSTPGESLPKIKLPSGNGGAGNQGAANANAKIIQGTCVHVVDGDTVHVKDQRGKKIIVRILGIDTMEPRQPDKQRQQAGRYRTTPNQVKAWGKEATRRAESMLRGKQVQLVNPLGRPQYDPHGRLLAYVEVNGTDYGEVLLREGLAEARREAQARRSKYQGIEREAKKAKRGIFKNL